MIALIIIGIIFALLALLLSLRVTVTLSYAEEIALSVKALGIRFRILPKKQRRGARSMSARRAEKIRRKRAKKAEKKAESARQKRRERAEKKTKKKKKSVHEILSLLRLITDLLKTVLGKFFHHIRIDLKRLRITVATSDAATTAVAYGAVTGTVSALLPLIESAKHFSLPKEGDLDVQADFLSETPSLDLHISVSLRVWHALDIALGALLSLVKHKLKSPPSTQNEGSQNGSSPSH